MPRRTKAPSLAALLELATANKRKPLAVVLAGHNGSGKSSLWKDRLSDYLQIPLINADRLTESILPARASPADPLPEWAQRLRDTDRKWQQLSQQSVKAVRSVAEKMQLSFGFETVCKRSVTAA